MRGGRGRCGRYADGMCGEVCGVPFLILIIFERELRYDVVHVLNCVAIILPTASPVPHPQPIVLQICNMRRQGSKDSIYPLQLNRLAMGTSHQGSKGGQGPTDKGRGGKSTAVKMPSR